MVKKRNQYTASFKAKAIRFSTLEAICRELQCQPGDLFEYSDSEK